LYDICIYDCVYIYMYICEEMTTFNIVLFPLLNENKGGGAPKDIHHKFLEA